MDKYRDTGTGVLGKPDVGSVCSDGAKHAQVEVLGTLPDDVETDPVAQVQTSSSDWKDSHKRGFSQDPYAVTLITFAVLEAHLTPTQ